MHKKYARDLMELRHLRYFVAVAETENVSRAALKLHLSQPALSRQIRDLEQEIGFSLLERGAKSVRLTDAGRAFLEESRAVLQRAEGALAAARTVAARGQNELHIGYAPTLTVRILPPALRAFQALQPGVRVKLHDLSTEEMLDRMRGGKLLLAFTVRPAPAGLRGLRFEALTRDPLRLAVAPGHPLARQRSVTLREAAQEPLIAYSRAEYPDYHELLTRVFASTKTRPRVAEEHDGASSLISAVEAGNGVAVVPASLLCVTGPRLKLLPLTPPPTPLVIGVISQKHGLGSVVEHFLQCTRQTISQRESGSASKPGNTARVTGAGRRGKTATATPDLRRRG